jgi:hypothetical protein
MWTGSEFQTQGAYKVRTVIVVCCCCCCILLLLYCIVLYCCRSIPLKYADISHACTFLDFTILMTGPCRCLVKVESGGSIIDLDSELDGAIGSNDWVGSPKCLFELSTRRTNLSIVSPPLSELVASHRPRTTEPRAAGPTELAYLTNPPADKFGSWNRRSCSP